MSRECEIVRDLLPLYAEGLSSQASNEMIEKHLESCEECRQILKEMKEEAAPQEIPEEKELPLTAFSKTYRRKKRSLAILIAGICVSVLISLYAWLSAPRYLTYTQAVEKTEETEHGVTVTFTDQVHHIRISSYRDPDDTKTYTDLECWTSTLDQLWHAETAGPAALEGDVIYLRDNRPNVRGQGDVILHGESEGASDSLRRLALNFYLLMAFAAFCILNVTAFIIRHAKSADILRQLSSVPLAWILGSVIVERGLGAATWSLTRDFSLICMLCVSLSIVLISLYRIRRERKTVSEG